VADSRPTRDSVLALVDDALELMAPRDAYAFLWELSDALADREDNLPPLSSVPAIKETGK
jgi:hypothetical protein